MLSLITYVFFSTKLEKRAEQVLPGIKGGGETVGRNDLNNVCTYEKMNKEEKKLGNTKKEKYLH
jgi:hypothetical protein